MFDLCLILSRISPLRDTTYRSISSDNSTKEGWLCPLKSRFNSGTIP